MAMTIDLNGIIIQGRVDGLEDFSVTRKRKEDGGGAISTFSAELTFYDDGYDILKASLIDPVNGFNEVVYVKVYDDCCGGAAFHGQIMGDAIDWCYPDCAIRANIVQIDEELSCIQNTLITVGNFGRKQHYPMRYCVEMRPQFIQILVNLFALIAEAIVTVVFGITLIFSWLDKDLKNKFQDSYYKITDTLIPCRNKHPSAYVKDYIINVCNHCGLTFESSIFDTSVYQDLMLINAFPKKGRGISDPDNSLIYENEPIETLETLFIDYLMPMFNADYRIYNGKLIFERKDYFLNLSQWMDTEQLMNEGSIVDNKICYSWIDKERYSFGEYEWQTDAIDFVSSEGLERWNDIVEWNPPAYPAGQQYSPAQRKSKQVFLAGALTRSPGDGLQNVFSSPVYLQNADVLFMNQHNCFKYKFVITSRQLASTGRINPYYSNTFTGQPIPGVGEFDRYNYPLWFKEGINGVYGYQNNLYSMFHYIDNPRWPTATKFNFEFTMQFECDDLVTFGFEKYVRLYVANQWRNGIVEEININYINRTIRVKGIA